MKMWIYPQVRRVHWFSYFPSTHCHLLFFFSPALFFFYIFYEIEKLIISKSMLDPHCIRTRCSQKLAGQAMSWLIIDCRCHIHSTASGLATTVGQLLSEPGRVLTVCDLFSSESLVEISM